MQPAKLRYDQRIAFATVQGSQRISQARTVRIPARLTLVDDSLDFPATALRLAPEGLAFYLNPAALVPRRHAKIVNEIDFRSARL
jgi:hypothetical protein